MLTAEMAKLVVEERIEAAEQFRRGRAARRSAPTADVYDSVTVRFAGEDDAVPLRRLAERDGRPLPAAPLLVAEVEGTLLAARSLVAGEAISDPFRPTAHLAELLALRTAHLRGGAPVRRRRFAGVRAAAHRLVRSYS
jgi:hypothetical protein